MPFVLFLLCEWKAFRHDNVIIKADNGSLWIPENKRNKRPYTDLDILMITSLVHITY